MKGRILQAAWAGTALFALTTIGAVAVPEPAFEVPAFIVSVALFLAGCGAFFAGYVRAVQRSRTDLIGIGDLFFLTGKVAPPEVRRALLGSLLLQVAVALGAAIARPYSSLAAATLVPVYGLGMTGLWASRHGTFERRSAPE